MTYADMIDSALSVRKISAADVRSALKLGMDDFMAMPTHVIFLALIYPLMGIVIARVTMGEGLLPLVYPLALGFAFVGPIAALGLYELSRRREQSLPVSWKHALDVFRSPSRGSIATIGVILLLIFAVWIASARELYLNIFGDMGPQSLGALVERTLTTKAGWALIVLGNGLGLLFAIVAFSLSVVSLPLLLDRPIGVLPAMMTSLRAVQANPGPMALWGLIVGISLVVGCLPLFIGLAVALPILGHATWHLYRSVVVRT